MQSSNLTSFETLELRKILGDEINTYKKIGSMVKMTTDEDLKSFLKKMKDTEKSNIQSIQNFMGNQ
ncbi:MULTISPECIES: hypothetical protein [Clostridium]|uniref:hypothetical protein n=1 Tax=Clostridium TaxID=1485 RepID=UPI0008255B1F|nr:MULTISPECIES: hypothetical protein [Clostridium]PJI09292.1 hypothetical protein CUB90_16025 [Clostridium sp. CT7]